MCVVQHRGTDHETTQHETTRAHWCKCRSSVYSERCRKRKEVVLRPSLLASPPWTCVYPRGAPLSRFFFFFSGREELRMVHHKARRSLRGSFRAWRTRRNRDSTRWIRGLAHWSRYGGIVSSCIFEECLAWILWCLASCAYRLIHVRALAVRTKSQFEVVCKWCSKAGVIGGSSGTDTSSSTSGEEQG